MKSSKYTVSYKLSMATLKNFFQNKNQKNMKKTFALIVLLTFMSGCSLSIFDNITNEATEAYDNVKTEVTEKTTAVQEKIDQLNQAAEDVSEAAGAISEAVDSIQQLTGDDDEEVTEETAINEEV